MTKSKKAKSSKEEIQLKFQLLSGSEGILLASNGFGLTAQNRRQIATYYDTSDQLLWSSGLSLKITQKNGNFVQIAKSRNSGSGLVRIRKAWEHSVKGGTPDLLGLSAEPEFGKISNQKMVHLRPAFVTDVSRTTKRFALEEATIVEVSLDIGSVSCGEKSEPICEVKLKLEQGKVGSLYRLANQFIALAPMWLNEETKAARGWSLSGGQKSPATPMRKAKISKDATAATALHQIIEALLSQVTSSVATTLSGDPESLRQLRRSLRHCRAVLQLFAPMVKRDETTRFNAPLRRFVRILGVTRDWDVLRLQTLPTAIAQLPEHDWVKLLDVAEVKRQIAHSEANNVICGSDFAKLLIDLAIFSENCATRPHKIGTKRLTGHLSDVTVTLLEQISGEAMRAGRHPLKQSMIELHDFRKALDKLNAAIRFLAGHYPKPTVSAYRDCTDLVRDIIGAANDAEVTKQLAEKLAADGRSDLSPIIDALVKWVDQQSEHGLTSLKRATQRLRAEPKFWNDYSML